MPHPPPALPLAMLLLCPLALSCGDDSSTDDAPPASTTDPSTTEAPTTGTTAPADTTDTTTTPPGTDTTTPPTVTVSGDAFAFALPGEPYGLIDGAAVSILEQPEYSVTTDAMGHFLFEDAPPGATATFVLERDGFPVAYTKTFTLPDTEPLEQVTFQVPDDALFDLLAGILMLEVDPAACQMVSTVTRVGKSLYDEGAHGEAGATVTVDPPLPPEHGPIYFNAAVIPEPSLTETSEDGGVLLVNVPPGTYTLHAEKPGVTFEDTIMRCDAGVLVNASPPYGLQALR